MGLIIIAIIVFIGVYVVFLIHMQNKCGIDFLAILLGFVLSLACSSLIIICVGCGVFIADKTILPDVESSTPIITLIDDEDTHGTRYLWRGTIDEDVYYRYIIEDEFGYEQKKIKADENTRVKYVGASTVPYVEVYGYEYSSGFARFLYGDCSDKFYIFYVPKGSIIVDGHYEVDMR